MTSHDMNDYKEKDTDTIYLELIEYSKTLNIIDAHEHFVSEPEHLKRYLSFYDYLAAYVKGDLASSGMNYGLLDYPENEEQAIDLFRKIKPFWQYVKYGSYARPVLLALKKFHGCDDLTEENIIKIGRELNERNKPGHFDEIFGAAKIERVLNQSTCGEKAFDDSRFCYGIPCEFDYSVKLRSFFDCCPDGNYDDYINMIDREMAQEVSNGAKLQKFFSDVFIQPLDKKAALEDFEGIRRNSKMSCSATLSSAIAHEKLDLCAKYGIVAAIHTGVWGDITRLSPSIMFPVVSAHWGTVFDIYHMGIPYARECAFLGKNYPHVYLNLCWSHCVSEQMTKTTMNEWLDLVPVNKIFGFGGDVNTLPEQVWGQLNHALENLSTAFAYRIKIGRMDIDYAKYVMKLWLYDNPKRIYKL
jgi:uncharacterized protein